MATPLRQCFKLLPQLIPLGDISPDVGHSLSSYFVCMQPRKAYSLRMQTRVAAVPRRVPCGRSARSSPNTLHGLKTAPLQHPRRLEDVWMLQRSVDIIGVPGSPNMSSISQVNYSTRNQLKSTIFGALDSSLSTSRSWLHDTRQRSPFLYQFAQL